MRTRVGYAGGTTDQPTYQSIGDHSEAIEIDYEPAVVTYAELLEVFLASHNPARAPFKRQYRSAIFYANPDQQRDAKAALEAESLRRGEPLATDLEPHTGFTLAEDYHQKYRLRSNPDLLASLRAKYPDPADFLAAPEVTRANAAS